MERRREDPPGFIEHIGMQIVGDTFFSLRFFDHVPCTLGFAAKAVFFL